MTGQRGEGIDVRAAGTPSFRFDPKTADEFYRKSVEAPLLRDFDRNIAPRIAQSFAGVGAFSSRQGTAIADALSGLNTNLAGERSRIMYQDRAMAAQAAEAAAGRRFGAMSTNAQLSDAAMGRSLQASQLASQFDLQPLLAGGQMASLLAPFQQRVDMQAQAGYNEFLRTLPENSPYTALALNFINQQHQAFMPQQGGLGAALGGGIGTYLMGTQLGLPNPLGLALLGGAAGGLGGF